MEAVDMNNVRVQRWCCTNILMIILTGQRARVGSEKMKRRGFEN